MGPQSRPDPDTRAAERRRFRRTLLQVMAVQVATLLLLLLVQLRYGG